MEPIVNIVYILIVGVVGVMTYGINQRLLLFFAWLEDLTTIGGEIINRLDRLANGLYDLSASFHNDYDFLSNRLFKTTIDSAKKEICKTVLEDMTNKNGSLKKKIADEIVRLAAERLKKEKDV